MGFSLFAEPTTYIDTETVGAFSSPGSFGEYAVGNIFGVDSASSTLVNSLVRGRSAHGYLVDTITGDRLIFQYNTLGRESGGANYENHPVLGRSLPLPHYKGGKERKLDLTIDFTMTLKTREDIRRAASFCRALVYPDYGGDGIINVSPHPVVLIQGLLYNTELWIATEYSLQYGEAIDPFTQLPESVQIQLTLQEVSESLKGHSDVFYL